MIPPTQFPAWLQKASEDGRGGLDAEPPSIVRGFSRSFILNLAEHDTYGDWSTGSFAARCKAAPDANSTLATWTASIGTPSGGITPVTFSLLSGTPQENLPTGVDGLAEVTFQIDYTPSSGAVDPIIQTRIFVSGAG